MSQGDDFLTQLEELARPLSALMDAGQYEQAGQRAGQITELIAWNQPLVAALEPGHRARLDTLALACRGHCLRLADLKADTARQLDDTARRIARTARAKPVLRAYHS